MTPQQMFDNAVNEQRAGRFANAIAIYRQLQAANPNAPELHFQLGTALQAMNKVSDSIAAYRAAIALRPDYAQAINALGTALRERALLDEAADAFRKAIALAPEQATPHYNLAVVLLRQGRTAESIAAFERAIQLQPDLIEAVGTLAEVYRVQGDYDAAIAQCQRALALRPEAPPALTIWGSVLMEMERYDEAMAMYDRALRANPDYAEAHWCRACLQLMRGQLRQGWREYEWRVRVRDLRVPTLVSKLPRWDGSPLNGKRVLINVEQGMGDTINFVRYAKKIANERGGRVVLDCQAPLVRLMQTVEGVEEVVERGQQLPPFDAHFPLMGLPALFETALQTIPAEVPYVSAPAEETARWRQRFDPADRRLRVGLAWSGSPSHANDRNRSMALAQLAPLAAVADVRFYSLQKGPAADQVKSAPAGFDLVDWMAELNDFADTAALMMNLDLVICVDTSVAHLAGALAKDVWVLLPKGPDYRWLLDRLDSPWYPTMRLFRQKHRGDWADVVRRVGEALGRRASANAE
ncbi:MAG TPA: tetratricopeptide repeat-containing glycosyltransferase family protein [Tepidisphaeraceae bacterium]|nr:tetratricopeptide repeat-containing glycosyltransferase family protein [Tepidisphaeraceae bacterium]